jgi:hypothetical protein
VFDKLKKRLARKWLAAEIKESLELGSNLRLDISILASTNAKLRDQIARQTKSNERYAQALTDISEAKTGCANGTVRKMARIADQALGNI